MDYDVGVCASTVAKIIDWKHVANVYNSGFLETVTKYSHLKSFRHRFFKRSEGVEEPIVVEVQVVFHVSDNSSPEQMSSKGLPVLPAVCEPAIDEPGNEMSSLNNPAPPTLVPKHLLHAGGQVVPDEHGGHGSGGGVQVFPRWKMHSVSAVEQATTKCSCPDHKITGVDAKEGKGEDGLAEIEKTVEEDKFQVDS